MYAVLYDHKGADQEQREVEQHNVLLTECMVSGLKYLKYILMCVCVCVCVCIHANALVHTNALVFLVCRFGVFRCVLTQCQGGKTSAIILREAIFAAHQCGNVLKVHFETIWSPSFYSEKDYSHVGSV